MDSLADEDSDAFCENVNNFTGDLRGALKVLDACQKLNAKSLVNLISEQFNMNIYVYNIDGNRSNFNTLTAELNCVLRIHFLLSVSLKQMWTLATRTFTLLMVSKVITVKSYRISQLVLGRPFTSMNLLML